MNLRKLKYVNYSNVVIKVKNDETTCFINICGVYLVLPFLVIHSFIVIMKKIILATLSIAIIASTIYKWLKKSTNCANTNSTNKIILKNDEIDKNQSLDTDKKYDSIETTLSALPSDIKNIPIQNEITTEQDKIQNILKQNINCLYDDLFSIVTEYVLVKSLIIQDSLRFDADFQYWLDQIEISKYEYSNSKILNVHKCYFRISPTTILEFKQHPRRAFLEFQLLDRLIWKKVLLRVINQIENRVESEFNTEANWFHNPQIMLHISENYLNSKLEYLNRRIHAENCEIRLAYIKQSRAHKLHFIFQFSDDEIIHNPQLV